ncbi:MAG: PH domain-containing protein [Firmicutes bacterium]|nr:PH domain-containing protein [Bacillota bacterium]
MANIIWKDRKRIIFGLPWSFTRYSLTEDKLLIDTGFLSRTEEEIRLYRIMDITLKRPLGQRLWGLGSVHLCTGDKSTPELDVKRIKNAKEFRDLLSNMVEKQREEKRIVAREFMDGDEAEDNHEL